MTREDFLVDGKDIADQRVVVHGPYSINVRGGEFLAFQTVTQIVLQTGDADRAGRKILFECKEHSCPDITVVGLAGTCAMTETNELTGITHDVPAQHCINVQTVYDTKVFIESMQAQDRPMPLHPPTAETPASTDEQSAVTASTSPGTGGAPPNSPTQLFKQGLRDRTNWELWFNSLDGDTKAGANYWAAQRSLAHPGNCGGTPDFSKGCYEAKVKLDESDTLRKSQPAYKAGWNSYITQAVNN